MSNKLKRKTYTVTIAISATDSSELDLGSERITEILPDANLTGTAITFKQAPGPGGTFAQVKDNSGSAISVTVAAGTPTVLSEAEQAQLGSLRYLKLTSGSTQLSAISTITIFTQQAG